MKTEKIQITEGANEIIFINKTNIAYEISIGKNSSLTIYDMQIEAHDTDRSLNINMDGEHGEVFVFGLHILDDNAKCKSRTIVNHNAQNCKSEQVYRAILDGKSRGDFEGGIYVAKNASGTDAHQESKNLLLSDTAFLSSVPSLEIHADDVKCSHGTTSGQLDPEAFFYMRSRGIGPEKAKELLTFAFAKTVIDKIKSPEIRSDFEIKVKRKLTKSCLHIYS